MGLFQIGYRRYEGRLTSQRLRWLPITRTGIRIAFRSKLLRWIGGSSFLPILYFAPVFFLIGRLTDPETANATYFDIARALLGPELTDRVRENPAGLRTAVWSAMFAGFGTKYQLWMVAIVTTIVGPALISNDIRSRSFLIYFARPVSRMDYVLGKTGTLVVMLAGVTLLPSIFLYAISILFSPSLGTVLQTASVAVAIVLASLGTIIPVALVMMTLSSIVRQPRFAAAAWIVLCLFGSIAHSLLQQTYGLHASKWTFLLSPADTMRTFQLGIYGVRDKLIPLGLDSSLPLGLDSLTSSDSTGTAAIWLVFVSTTSLFILLRRVEAPTRI